MDTLQIDQCEICILGAGIAGLNALFAASQYLGRNDRVVLVDRRTRVGGMWTDTYDYVARPKTTAATDSGLPGLPSWAERWSDLFRPWQLNQPHPQPTPVGDGRCRCTSSASQCTDLDQPGLFEQVGQTWTNPVSSSRACPTWSTRRRWPLTAGCLRVRRRCGSRVASRHASSGGATIAPSSARMRSHGTGSWDRHGPDAFFRHIPMVEAQI